MVINFTRAVNTHRAVPSTIQVTLKEELRGSWIELAAGEHSHFVDHAVITGHVGKVETSLLQAMTQIYYVLVTKSPHF